MEDPRILQILGTLPPDMLRSLLEMSKSAVADPKVLEELPAELLEMLPVQTPPLGIQSNFVDPASRVPVILGIGSTFFALALLCFIIRVYTKIAILKKWRWDDTTCTIGFMFSILYFVWVVIGCVHPTAPTGRHGWDVPLSHAMGRVNLLLSYFTVVCVTPALGFIKISLFIQYYLLFGVLRYVKISVYIGATICVAFYASVSITAFVLCSPWTGETLFRNIWSWHYLKFAEFSIPTGAIGMVIDILLLILPMPAVWNLKMSLKKRIGLTFVFMTGALAVVASILNLYYRTYMQNDTSDPFWKVGYIYLWTIVEMCAGVTASSMPTVKHFFGNFFADEASGSSQGSSQPTLVSTSRRFLLSTREKLSKISHKSASQYSEKTDMSGTTRASYQDTDGIHLTQDVSVTWDHSSNRSVNSHVGNNVV